MASRPDTSGRYTPGNEAARLREAARVFYPENFPGECVVAILGGSPGYSGSAFARVEASGRSWCLRGWPLGFGGERLRFVHRALLAIRAGGFHGVPNLASTAAGETVAEISGRLYDAQEWMAGRPLSARTDNGWAGEPMPNMVVRPSPRRLDALTVETAEHVGPLMRVVLARDAGEESEVAWRWLELLPGALAAAREASEALPDEGGGTRVVCHGGLWPAHAWFDGEAFVGFTDLESLTFASPALNLAQLVTHFPGWGAEKRSAVSTNPSTRSRKETGRPYRGRRGPGGRGALVALVALRRIIVAGKPGAGGCAPGEPAVPARIPRAGHRGREEEPDMRTDRRCSVIVHILTFLMYTYLRR